MHWRQENCEKYCILVCAKPHEIGCSLVGPCYGLSCAEIVKRMAQMKQIAVSVISVQRHPRVDAIFEAVQFLKFY